MNASLVIYDGTSPEGYVALEAEAAGVPKKRAQFLSFQHTHTHHPYMIKCIIMQRSYIVAVAIEASADMRQ